MAKKRAYVVFVGRIPGIYETWAECAEQVDGYRQAKFKGYTTYDEAIEAWEEFEEQQERLKNTTTQWKH